jgi:glycosyltransferase involved in cell wall biosynthesis
MSERVEIPWPGHPYAPAPLALFARTSRGNADGTLTPAVIVDDAGRAIRKTPLLQLRELARHAWLRVCTGALRAIAWLVTKHRAPEVAAATPGPGPVVLVLPVLPDLSHTFVYREVLAMRRQRPDWRVVALARDARAPVHAEAAELAKHAVFLRRDGITAAAARALRWLLRRRGRELFALYRAQPGGSTGDLLGKLPLRDARHPGNAFALADQLRALRPRHVHVYASTYATNVAMGAAHLLGVPFSISSYVDFEFPYAHKMLAAKLARTAFFRVVTAYCRDRLLALPETAAIAAERVPVILLGLDLANWQQRAALRGDGVLVSAARLVRKKGLHVVPKALATLRARGVACRWRVLGDGPERDALQRACTEHGVAGLVEFVGPRDNAAVRAELLTADLALLPCVVAPDGDRDGIPIFLCEAMALGVPVVTTPVSGIPELVRDGDTGFLARPEDSDALADVLQRALGDRELARAVGERGRAAVNAKLDVDVLTRDLVAWIER